MIVNRNFHCHHCWTRLVCYSDAEGGNRVEVDLLGEKREKMDNSVLIPRLLERSTDHTER